LVDQTKLKQQEEEHAPNYDNRYRRGIAGTLNGVIVAAQESDSQTHASTATAEGRAKKQKPKESDRR
jgi:hypothetical protein